MMKVHYLVQHFVVIILLDNCTRFYVYGNKRTVTCSSCRWWHCCWHSSTLQYCWL